MIFYHALALIPLTVIVVYDIRTYRIPDELTIGVGILGILNAYLHSALITAFISIMALLVIPLAAKLITERIMGRITLGWGDVKLFPACGAFLRIEEVPLFLFLSGAGGLVSHAIWRNQVHFPFAPAIVCALIGTLAVRAVSPL